MKISFDFDQTLSYESVQDFAIQCQKLGCEIWIVTSRFKNNHNDDLYEIASKLNIPENNIVFTSWEDKAKFFELNPDFIFHLDDDSIEIEFIEEYTTVPGINVFCDVEWKNKCLNLIQNETEK